MNGVYAHRSSTFTPEQASNAAADLLARIRAGKTLERPSLEENDLFKAIRVSSPSLANAIERATSDSISETDASLIERAIDRYAARAAQRATPFGLFAGIGQMNSAESTVSRRTIEMTEWTSSPVQTTPSANSILYANMTVQFERGRAHAEELVLQNDSAQRVESWFPRNAAVEAVWRRCTTGASFLEAASHLQSLNADITIDRIHEFILKLVRAQVLFSIPTDASPVSLITGTYDENAASGDSDTTVISKWVTVGAVSPPPTSLQRKIQGLARTLATTYRHSPAEVSREKYENKFLSRYGIGVRVPLTLAFDPVLGIGRPALEISEYSPPEKVIALQLDLLVRGSESPQSVEISDEELSLLVDSDRRHLSYSTDAIYSWDIEKGRVGFAPLASTALVGQSLGRFWPAVPPEWSIDPTESDATGHPVESVQLLYFPRQLKHLNIVAMPRGTARYIAVHFRMQDDNCLSLSDLELCHDGTRLRIYPRGEIVPVVIRNMSMFNYPSLASPLVTSLMLLGAEHEREWAPFTWATQVESVRLPEITTRGVVISKAIWRLPRALFDRKLSDGQWSTAFIKWAEYFNVPSRVEVGQEDQLRAVEVADVNTHPVMRKLISRRSPVLYGPVHTGEQVAREYVQRINVGPNLKQGLHRKTVMTASPVWSSRAREPDWISFELVSGSVESPHPSILESLVALVSRFGIPEWHFVQYSQPDVHLRWRARTESEDVRAALRRAVLDLERNHVDSIREVGFWPEYERYGSRSAFDNSFTRIFTLSSEAAFKSHMNNTSTFLEHLNAALASALAIFEPFVGEDWRRFVTNAYREVRAPARYRTMLRDIASAPALSEYSRLEQFSLSSSSGRQMAPPRVAEMDHAVASALHMHANRFFGTSRDREEFFLTALKAWVLQGRRFIDVGR